MMKMLNREQVKRKDKKDVQMVGVKTLNLTAD